MRDEAARRRVGRAGSAMPSGERGDDRTGERLAELDAELVERIDAVEHGFDERPVLVQREQLAEPIRVELRHQDRRRRAVARAHARGDGRLERRAGTPFADSSARTRRRAAPREQRLRLRQRVRDQQRLLVRPADARRAPAR